MLDTGLGSMQAQAQAQHRPVWLSLWSLTSTRQQYVMDRPISLLICRPCYLFATAPEWSAAFPASVTFYALEAWKVGTYEMMVW